MSFERDPSPRHDDPAWDGLIARFLLEPGELRRTFGPALGPADADDADLERMRPVYEWIFRELRSRGCRWIYAFPRIYLGDFRAHRVGDEDPTEYDASEAVR